MPHMSFKKVGPTIKQYLNLVGLRWSVTAVINYCDGVVADSFTGWCGM